jgi:hypothetical protein
MGIRVAGTALLVVTLLASIGCGASRPAKFWTVRQAESIKLVRGTPLKRTRCVGLGIRRASAYRRFSCVGVVAPKSVPDRPVRVRYMLNPRSKYKGDRSAYLATSVHFESFGVP